MAREYTTKLEDMAEQGVMSWETIAREALCRMSEDQVEEMCVDCDWITPYDFDDENDENDEDDEEKDEEIPDGEAGAYVDRIENPEKGTIGW